MKPIDADKNALDATKALLDFSKVPATRRGLKEALWQHPDFPSLNALSDVLNDFQVPNLSTRLTPDRLHEIPLPALTYLNIDGGMFAPLRNVNGSVEWLHTQRGWQKESLGQFAQKWSGVTLLIEPNEQSGERDYAQNRRRETLGVLRVLFITGAILAILGLLVSSALQTFPWAGYSAYYLMGLTKLAGTIVNGMLVWYSLDTQNSFLQKVCQINGRSNCQNILNSSAAMLTDWLSWAEVGLFYFAGGLMTLAIGLWLGNNGLLTSLGGSLYLLTLLALPYTIWSVNYQWRVAREWCVLCLTVQALIWVEFYIGYTNFGSPLGFMARETLINMLPILAISFLIVTSLWIYMKPIIVRSLLYIPLFKNHQKVKFDEAYINSTFEKQVTMPPVFDEMITIKIGNSNAKHRLTIISSMLCTPCAINHKKVRKLIENNDEICCEYIFIGTYKALNIANTILNAPAAKQVNLLNNWYQNINQNQIEWCKNSNCKDISLEADSQQVRLHAKWSQLAGISETPTVFLNGIKFPVVFDIVDIHRVSEALHLKKTIS